MEKLQELILDSREVAKMMHRNHTELLRNIERYSSYLAESIERKIALSGSPCQRFRQWIQKKGGECVNTLRPWDSSPEICISSSLPL